MKNQIVITVISEDRPGVVEKLASTISHHGGNWLESRMAQLAGSFAGIVQVDVDDAHKSALIDALHALSIDGFKIQVEQSKSADAFDGRQFRFSLVGGDRQGIVKEIAQAFSSRHINMSDLDTTCSSTPWSGEPLFEAAGIIDVPKSVDMNELYDHLDKIGDELALDIRLESSTDQ